MASCRERFISELYFCGLRGLRLDKPMSINSTEQLAPKALVACYLDELPVCKTSFKFCDLQQQFIVSSWGIR